MTHTRSALCLLLFASIAPAADVTFIVAAGKHARVNEPVRVPLQLDEKTSLDAHIEIKDDKDAIVTTGQLAHPDLVTEAVKAEKGRKRLDVVFILPKLDADKTVTLKASFTGKERETTTSFNAEGELSFAGRPVFKYINPTLDETSPEKREATMKVFHHVYDPTGKFLVTKGVGGHFTHHRGIFYGFAKCSYDNRTVDIWHCRDKMTHQAHREVKQSGAGPVLGYHRLAIDWNGFEKKTFANELRELSAYNVKGGTMIDFVSKLTPTGSEVKVDGDPQHAGFHFRASNEVAERQADKKAKPDDLTIFVRPDGEGKPGSETNWPGNKKHVDLPWLAMSFVVQGKRYTACYLDLPTNPKEARFSERSYGRFGSYFVATATKDKPLLVRYRIWLQEGKMKGEEVAALRAMFAEPVTVTLK